MVKVALLSVVLLLCSCSQKQSEYYITITPCEHCMEQLATTIDNTKVITEDPLEELVS